MYLEKIQKIRNVKYFEILTGKNPTPDHKLVDTSALYRIVVRPYPDPGTGNNYR